MPLFDWARQFNRIGIQENEQTFRKFSTLIGEPCFLINTTAKANDTTDILLTSNDTTDIKRYNWHLPDLFCRYVDDLFLLFPNEDSLNRFFTNINSVHRNIVFTKELETNNCLHFLDVSIEKTSTGFITSLTGNPLIQVSTRNGRVSFRYTGNETLSTLYSAALMILPVPTSW